MPESAKRCGRIGSSLSEVTSTSRLPFSVTVRFALPSPLGRDAASNALVIEFATVFAVSSVPSWNFTPSRSLNTTVFASGVSHDSASPGAGFPSESKVTSVSAIPRRVFKSASSENGDSDATGLNGHDTLILLPATELSSVKQAVSGSVHMTAAVSATIRRFTDKNMNTPYDVVIVAAKSVGHRFHQCFTTPRRNDRNFRQCDRRQQ